MYSALFYHGYDYHVYEIVIRRRGIPILITTGFRMPFRASSAGIFFFVLGATDIRYHKEWEALTGKRATTVPIFYASKPTFKPTFKPQDIYKGATSSHA